MFGLPVTSGLSANRSSRTASGTINKSGWRMVCAQKEMSRGVSFVDKPILDLNHCRFSSMSEISEMGVSQMRAAKAARSSNASSGGPSSKL